VAGVYNILVVGRDATFKTGKDVADAAKAAPDKVTCATVGSGSSQQLSCALFMGVDRHQADAGAVSRRRARHRRHDGWPGRFNVGQHAGSSWARSAAGRPARHRLRRGLRFAAAARGAGDLPDRPQRIFVIHNWFGIVGPSGMFGGDGEALERRVDEGGVVARS